MECMKVGMKYMEAVRAVNLMMVRKRRAGMVDGVDILEGLKN